MIEQGIAVRAGIRALKSSIFEILRNREEELSPRMVQPITGLCEDWLWLDERIEQVTGEIEKIAASEPNCRLLMCVPGVGPIISTAMTAAIDDGEVFERGRDFGAWLGLVPRQYSTGGRSILGRISKRGDPYLRTMFIQAVKVLPMRPQSWERFSFGPWLEQGAPRMHRNKLATALANKLARISPGRLCSMSATAWASVAPPRTPGRRTWAEAAHHSERGGHILQLLGRVFPQFGQPTATGRRSNPRQARARAPDPGAAGGLEPGGGPAYVARSQREAASPPAVVSSRSTSCSSSCLMRASFSDETP